MTVVFKIKVMMTMITTIVVMVKVVEKKYGIETNFMTNAGFSFVSVRYQEHYSSFLTKYIL